MFRLYQVAVFVALFVSAAEAFTARVPSIFPPPRLTTRLYVIDEEAVAASVKIPGVDVPKTAPAPKYAPAPELPPAPVPGLSADTDAPVVVAAPPPPAPVVVAAPPSKPMGVAPAASSGGGMALDLPGGLSAPIIGGGLLAAFAAATFAMRNSVDEAAVSSSFPPSSSASSSAPPATSSATDLSIPYDAAARLAYEKAGSPGDYAAFKAKYEDDAVADVIAKKNK